MFFSKNVSIISVSSDLDALPSTINRLSKIK